MRQVSDTIARLAAFRALPAQGGQAPAGADGLSKFENFGPNPGALDAWAYLPGHPKTGRRLVVVMHGCTQNARDYAAGSGWLHLAKELGFALLLPEQRRANNINLCFNWYQRDDNRRGVGEAASIKQMIDRAIEREGIDPNRVFVNGMSAGGAMTSVMLAAYPETFAAGAIIAGLPYGSASSVPEAFDRMRGHGGPDGAGLAHLVRVAGAGHPRWPAISVWHGDADHTVSPTNADNIIEQWRFLHEVAKAPDVSDLVNGYPHRAWHDRSGRPVIQDYRITGMGHGTPLATDGDEECGEAGAHMLDVGISSTRRIAYDWGLGGTAPQAAKLPSRPKQRNDVLGARMPPVHADGVQNTIENALRAAGLM